MLNWNNNTESGVALKIEKTKIKLFLVFAILTINMTKTTLSLLIEEITNTKTKFCIHKLRSLQIAVRPKKMSTFLSKQEIP